MDFYNEGLLSAARSVNAHNGLLLKKVRMMDGEYILEDFEDFWMQR